MILPSIFTRPLRRARAALSALAIVPVLLVVAAGTGCQNYRLGTGGELPFKRIYVAPVINRSLAPQAQDQVTDQIIRQLMRDNRVTIVSDPTAADAELTVTLIEYRRNVAATSEKDTFIGQSFELGLTASVTLTNREDGNDYFTARIVTADVNAGTEGGFQASEYQAMTALARDLATRIVTQVTAVW